MYYGVTDDCTEFFLRVASRYQFHALESGCSSNSSSMQQHQPTSAGRLTKAAVKITSCSSVIFTVPLSRFVIIEITRAVCCLSSYGFCEFEAISLEHFFGISDAKMQPVSN
jgi:hypothetical protein